MDFDVVFSKSQSSHIIKINILYGFYERDFMLCLSEDTQSEVIEAFNSTSTYLDDPLNIDNNFFNSMVNHINPSELQLNEAKVSDIEASNLDLDLSIPDGFVQTKIYDERDDFDFNIVNFPFLDGDVSRSTSYGIYDFQLIRFAWVSSHVNDFNTFSLSFQKDNCIYKKTGYSKDVLQRTACLVVNRIKVNSFAYLLECSAVES